MQPHLDLILLADLHREALLAEAERGRVQPTASQRGLGVRAWLASALVGLALLLDWQAASAGVEAALGRPRGLPRHT